MLTDGTASFDEFSEKREDWLNWVTGDDSNSISNQISGMLLDDTTFRIIIEARRLTPKTEDGILRINLLVHGLIDKCFFTTQTISIRRLLDSRRDVCSLMRLLDDIKSNCQLITREHVFAAEGREYDVSLIKRRWEDFSREQERQGQDAYSVPSEYDWIDSEDRHKDMDELSGTTENQRKPDDAALPGWIDNLKARLSSCRDIVDYVNKFVAHAATPESRDRLNADAIKIPLGKLWEAHEILCKTAHLLAHYVLGTDLGSLLPIPMLFSRFAFIDQPLVTQADIPHLQSVSDKQDRDAGDWSQVRLEWLGSLGDIPHARS